MAATVKAAAFASFLRVWLEAFPGAYTAWHGTLAALAITTMIVGNAIGLAQRNLKRLLAYSSIGHAGYLMVAIAPGTLQGARVAKTRDRKCTNVRSDDQSRRRSSKARGCSLISSSHRSFRT